MAPSKAPSSWEDEESESTPPSSPPAIAVARRSKFDDEEEDDDVLDDWEEQEDSEVEREKAKKAAEAKAKAEAEARAQHKSKSQRIEERRLENMKKKAELLEESSEEDEEEDEAERRARLRESEKASDLKHAEDLFSGIGVSDKRGDKPITVQEGDDPGQAIDLSSLKLFQPATAPQFQKLRDTLVPLLNANSKKAPYALFMQEFTKQICKDLSSEQMKKVASGLTTMSNEKMKEEKAAEKGGKKTKAAKTKSSLSANRNIASTADTTAYEGGPDEEDFM